MNRKDFLKMAAATLAGGALTPHLSNAQGVKSDRKKRKKEATSSPRKKAKSVILVFLAGGPSHTDTFDPKPAAGRDIIGIYKEPIKTNNPALVLNENLKQLATIADKYSVIRSMTHYSNAHEIGQYLMYTGDMTRGKIVYPSFGSMISYLNPTGYSGMLPPYINFVRPAARFNEGGFLGSVYKPLNTLGKPEASLFEVEGIINRMVNDQLLTSKQDLLASVCEFQEMAENEEVAKLDKLQQENFDMLLGKSRAVFDLKQEDQELRDRYGMNDFGQSCLAARRLVEYGVPVVGVTYHGWDTHKEHFKRMNQRLGTLDQGLATLISDLDEKGLLDETIVLCGGEFGRTPQILWAPPWNGGRNHFGAAFSFLVAGGGFKGGEVLGKTDDRSETVVERPVYPADLIGSVYELMGIDPYMKLSHPLHGELPILPSLGQEKQSAGLLHELYVDPPTERGGFA